MDLETLSHIVRELSRKITDRGDERALDELIDLIFDLKSNERALRLVTQLLHDEKTYVLSDTEILTSEERRLINVAALYHALYMLCRAISSRGDVTEISSDKLIEALIDKNLTETTLILEEAIRKILYGDRDERNKVLKVINNVLNRMEIDEHDLRSYLMLSLVVETRKLIEKLLERVNHEVQKH